LSSENVASDAEVPVALIDPYSAAKSYLHAFHDAKHAVNPIMPDPFSRFPLAPYRCPSYANVTVTNGTTACDGSVAIRVRADPMYTWASAGISAAHAITGWNTPADVHGSLGAAHYCRPVVCGAYVTYLCTGDPHHVRYSMTRSGPDVYGSQTSCAAVPTYTNLGVTAAQVSNCFGHDAMLQPENNSISITFANNGTVSATKFILATTERGEAGSDCVFLWLYGLRSTDLVSVNVVMHYEYYPGGTSTWLDPSQIRLCGSSSMASDLAQGMITNSIAAGDDIKQANPEVMQNSAEQAKAQVDTTVKQASTWDKVDDIISTGSKIAGGLFDILGPLLLPASLAVRLSSLPKDHCFRTSLTNTRISELPAIRLAPSRNVKPPLVESKDDIEEQPVLLTPDQARRPSIASSLTTSRKR
jgi:hypothetical protein